MTTTAELVRNVCDQLDRYIDDLRPLLAEPDSPAEHATPGAKGALAHAPLPGNAAALLASTGIHGFARWWEAILLWEHGASGPWNRRGGSDANTRLALEAITRLVEGASGDAVDLLLADLYRAEADAAVHPAIDEAQQWRHMRGRPCPYCGCFFLKVLLDSAGRATGHVECFTVRCGDGNGQRPVAGMGTDEQGRPVLMWADGMVETVPDMED